MATSKPKKRKYKRRAALVSKIWKGSDGISKLPAAVLSKVRETLDRLKVGVEQQENFFGVRLNVYQRMAVGYELSLHGLSYQDIAKLLGMSVSATFNMLDRARVEALSLIPPQWLMANFVDDYLALKSEAQWNAAQKESVDGVLAVSFSRNAIMGRSKAGEFLLKAEELTKGIGASKDGQPNQSDRESQLQWVYENKILPKLIEAPEEEQ